MIIEQLAEKEQTEDLEGFLRRESVFDSQAIVEAEKNQENEENEDIKLVD